MESFNNTHKTEKDRTFVFDVVLILRVFFHDCVVVNKTIKVK